MEWIGYIYVTACFLPRLFNWNGRTDRYENAEELSFKIFRSLRAVIEILQICLFVFNLRFAPSQNHDAAMSVCGNLWGKTVSTEHHNPDHSLNFLNAKWDCAVELRRLWFLMVAFCIGASQVALFQNGRIQNLARNNLFYYLWCRRVCA
jgi:hypothetical protein